MLAHHGYSFFGHVGLHFERRPIGILGIMGTIDLQGII